MQALVYIISRSKCLPQCVILSHEHIAHYDEAHVTDNAKIKYWNYCFHLKDQVITPQSSCTAAVQLFNYFVCDYIEF